MTGITSLGLATLPKAEGKAARLGLFALHTLAAYLCAVRLSPWLVFHWFGWVAPLLHIVPNTTVGDWYLQHLIWITALPSLAVGCLGARFLSPAAGAWAWSVPTVVLGYKILLFHAPHSVLIGTLMSPFRYYFEIQRVMPNRTNFLSIDGARVLAQMLITAPFYAGVAYSLGAWAWSRWSPVARRNSGTDGTDPVFLSHSVSENR